LFFERRNLNITKSIIQNEKSWTRYAMPK